MIPIATKEINTAINVPNPRVSNKNGLSLSSFFFSVPRVAMPKIAQRPTIASIVITVIPNSLIIICIKIINITSQKPYSHTRFKHLLHNILFLNKNL